MFAKRTIKHAANRVFHTRRLYNAANDMSNFPMLPHYSDPMYDYYYEKNNENFDFAIRLGKEWEDAKNELSELKALPLWKRFFMA